MNLDSLTGYKKYDPEDTGFGIENLAEQVRMAWHDTREFEAPANYKDFEHIVLAGMGGSATAPHMLLAAWQPQLKVPFTIVRDYALPGWVGAKTLVILSSFSGSTEEILSAAAEAQERKAKIVVIATGGVLVELAQKHGWPSFTFDPHDLAKQPRFGSGFLLMGTLGVLERLSLLKVKETELAAMTTAMCEVVDACAVDVPTSENPAKLVATELKGKQILILAAEHLVGNAHALTNSCNETGKQFAVYYELPEANHHLLESFSHPKGIAKDLVVLMLRSKRYHGQTQKRFAITADFFEEYGAEVVEYAARGESALEEVGEVLQFGSYVAWYLAMLNKVQAMSIPYVDEFKRRLAQK